MVVLPITFWGAVESKLYTSPVARDFRNLGWNRVDCRVTKFTLDIVLLTKHFFYLQNFCDICIFSQATSTVQHQVALFCNSLLLFDQISNSGSMWLKVGPKKICLRLPQRQVSSFFRNGVEREGRRPGSPRGVCGLAVSPERKNDISQAQKSNLDLYFRNLMRTTCDKSLPVAHPPFG